MKITIECDCGNKIEISALRGKYIQFRDRLEQKNFHYEDDTKSGYTKEFRIMCDKCKCWITLGVD